MGIIPPPPPPLPVAEFINRIAAGAKTLDEIDPEFVAWVKLCNRRLKIRYCIMIAGVIAMLVTVAVLSR